MNGDCGRLGESPLRDSILIEFIILCERGRPIRCRRAAALWAIASPQQKGLGVAVIFFVAIGDMIVAIDGHNQAMFDIGMRAVDDRFWQ